MGQKVPIPRKGNIQLIQGFVMKYQLALLAFFLVSSSIFLQGASAQDCVNLCVAQQFYKQGDTIVISGKVDVVLPNTPLLIQVYRESNRVQIAQVDVAEDGSFTYTFVADGPYFQTAGKYVIQASYGPTSKYEASFEFQTTETATATNDVFEVKAGSSGTFDVPYTIKGGSVNSMVVDTDILGLLVTIQSDTDGYITLDLPRKWIDAKTIEGNDDQYIIFIDGLEVTYQETKDADSRVLTIQFEQGDSDIEIIGTQVVPEFGPIAMIVLVVAITATIAVSAKRNLLQIRL